MNLLLGQRQVLNLYYYVKSKNTFCCENYTLLYNFLACKEVLYCHINYNIVRVVHHTSHCCGFVLLEMIFMHVLTQFQLHNSCSIGTKRNIFNGARKWTHVIYPLHDHMFRFFFIVYADIFIVRYNGPVSLDPPGSLTEEAVRLYCLNHECK